MEHRLDTESINVYTFPFKDLSYMSHYSYTGCTNIYTLFFKIPSYIEHCSKAEYIDIYTTHYLMSFKCPLYSTYWTIYVY